MRGDREVLYQVVRQHVEMFRELATGLRDGVFIRDGEAVDGVDGVARRSAGDGHELRPESDTPVV